MCWDVGGGVGEGLGEVCGEVCQGVGEGVGKCVREWGSVGGGVGGEEVLKDMWESVLMCGEVKKYVGKCGGGMRNPNTPLTTLFHNPHTSPNTSPQPPGLPNSSPHLPHTPIHSHTSLHISLYFSHTPTHFITPLPTLPHGPHTYPNTSPHFLPHGPHFSHLLPYPNTLFHTLHTSP